MTRSGLAPDDQTSDVLGSVDSAHVLCDSRVLRLCCTATLVEFFECPSFDEWLITQPGATTAMTLQTESVGGSYTTVLVDLCKRRGADGPRLTLLAPRVSKQVTAVKLDVKGSWVASSTE